MKFSYGENQLSIQKASFHSGSQRQAQASKQAKWAIKQCQSIL